MDFIQQRKSFVQELFKERNLRAFNTSDQELQSARSSLILKKKCQSNIHSILFCKTKQIYLQQTAKKQKHILLEQKNKYFEYIRKTFKDKIPVEFQSESKFKRSLKNHMKQMKQAQKQIKNETIKKRQAPIASFNKIDQRNKKVKKNQNKVNNKNKDIEIKDNAKEQIYMQDDENKIQEDNNESQIDLQNDQINDQSYVNQEEYD